LFINLILKLDKSIDSLNSSKLETIKLKITEYFAWKEAWNIWKLPWLTFISLVWWTKNLFKYNKFWYWFSIWSLLRFDKESDDNGEDGLPCSDDRKPIVYCTILFPTCPFIFFPLRCSLSLLCPLQFQHVGWVH